MCFGLLKHPMEEEPCDKNQLSLLFVVILIVVAVGYYSYGDRYRNIKADINSVDKYTGDAATTTRVKPLWR